MTSDSLDDLTAAAEQFAEDRDWGRFHIPKNLAMALAGEVGELVAELQWLSDDEIRSALDDGAGAARRRIEDEIGDVLIYLALLAARCQIDPVAVAHRKLQENDEKYPVAASYGTAEKYSRIGHEKTAAGSMD